MLLIYQLIVLKWQMMYVRSWPINIPRYVLRGCVLCLYSSTYFIFSSLISLVYKKTNTFFTCSKSKAYTKVKVSTDANVYLFRESDRSFNWNSKQYRICGLCRNRSSGIYNAPVAYPYTFSSSRGKMDNTSFVTAKNAQMKYVFESDSKAKLDACIEFQLLTLTCMR